ncbi:aspartyl protease family protein [Methylobacterium radiotolerans]|uniref:aspartyl protease family protein n=1 Tax=Methylobacterium radiotolerans TaxID=31998 RepID=UPI001F18067F|nr:aspartyl protease family protein [Methylobacterium radiotolerans]UIY45800.1 aspartyl protease family protein [Methylobacterium radiotolerans]
MLVGIGGLRARAFAMQGKPAPSLTSLTFLADTGAEVSVIDVAVAKRIGLRRINVGLVNTGSSGATPAQCDDYEISLQILDPATRVPAFSAASLTVIGTDLSAQRLDGILGRDVLNHGLATFHGPKQQLILDI